MITKIKMYLIIVGITLALGAITNMITAYKFYQRGRTAEINVCRIEKEKAVDQKLDIRERQDEIRNAPIDNDVTDRRLFDGTF